MWKYISTYMDNDLVPAWSVPSHYQSSILKDWGYEKLHKDGRESEL